MIIVRTAALAARDVSATTGMSMLATVALGLIATAWHAATPANTDVAWLLTVGDHILDGARPYVDIIETNPPGSVLLYLPAVMLGRGLGTAPEVMVVVLTALACLGSLMLSAAILRRVKGIDVRRAGLLFGIAGAIVSVLPASSFGQREHVILLTSLPLLAVLVGRIDGSPPAPRLLGLIAGIGAGIGFAVKPHYALGLAGPLVLLARAGGWRGLFAAWEVWLALAVSALLGLAQLQAFPDFTHTVLPLLLRIYLPDRQSWTVLLTSPSAVLEGAGLLAYAGLRRRGLPQPIGDTAALASVGFFAAALLQGKGWPYHAYPAVAAVLLGLGALLTGQDRSTRPGRVTTGAGTAAAALVAILATLWFDAHLDLRQEAPGLEQAVSALGPHPRLMSLSSDIAVGHPLARQVGGRWVGTLMSSWISLGVYRLTGALDRAGPHGPDLILQDTIMASDIRERRPDAILATAPGWPAWIASQSAVARALDDYRPSGTFGSVMLLTRKAP